MSALFRQRVFEYRARRCRRSGPGVPEGFRRGRSDDTRMARNVAVFPGATQAGGFTLLELLLATAIFSIVLIAINTVFFAALQLRKSTTSALDEALPLERALAVIRKDLQNVAVPGGVLAGHFRSVGGGSTLGSGGLTRLGGSQAQATTGSGATPAATAVQGGFDFFTTTGILREGVPAGDIQEVNYQLMEPLEGDKALGQDLVRSVTRNLLSYVTPVPEEQRLLNNVEAIEFHFYDGYDWRDTWDTSQSDTNLPVAVRMRLLPAVERERQAVRREPIEMIVLLAQAATAGESLSDTNAAAGGEQ